MNKEIEVTCQQKEWMGDITITVDRKSKTFTFDEFLGLDIKNDLKEILKDIYDSPCQHDFRAVGHLTGNVHAMCDKCGFRP